MYREVRNLVLFVGLTVLFAHNLLLMEQCKQLLTPHDPGARSRAIAYALDLYDENDYYTNTSIYNGLYHYKFGRETGEFSYGKCMVVHLMSLIISLMTYIILTSIVIVTRIL